MTEVEYIENMTIGDVYVDPRDGIESNATVTPNELMPHLPDEISKGVVKSWATGAVEPDVETFEIVSDAIGEINILALMHLNDPSDLKYVLLSVGTHDSDEDSDSTYDIDNVGL